MIVDFPCKLKNVNLHIPWVWEDLVLWGNPLENRKFIDTKKKVFFFSDTYPCNLISCTCQLGAMQVQYNIKIYYNNKI